MYEPKENLSLRNIDIPRGRHSQKNSQVDGVDAGGDGNRRPPATPIVRRDFGDARVQHT